MHERLKKLRKTLDLTQQEFAERIGSKRNTVAKYETAANTPSAAVVSLICREFNVNKEWLRNGTGEMFNPTTNSELNVLIKRYGLSDNDRIVIEKFINLKSEQRNAVIKYVTDLARALNDSDIASQSSDNEFAEELSLTVEEAEAEYIKSRLDTARKTGLSALNTSADTTNPIRKESIDRASNQ